MNELKNTTLTKQPELKEAILSLSEKEKDKLLIRLINKDKKLIEQLHFLLLETEHDLLERIQEAKRGLKLVFERMNSGMKKIQQQYKHKELTGYLKAASGIVNEHASITKSKESELDLRLLIFEETFKTYPTLYISDVYGYKADTHFAYQITRLKSVLALYDKLHEDLQYEYQDRLIKIIEIVKKTILNDYALAVELDLNKY